MSAEYRSLSTAELEQRWNGLRLKIESQNGGLSDIDALYAIRRELDRRRGESSPIVEVNFEEYVKE